MGKAGRPSKPGSKRYKCGKRKTEAALYDRGSEWVQAQRARFGEHYSSALGRAYASGLLGPLDSDEAKRLYDAGKAFARTYNAVIGPAVYRCPLNDAPRSGHVALVNDPEMHEREMRRQEWLFAAMDSLDVDGSRPWLDQLISNIYTDHGPTWLDAILDGSKDPVDAMFLKAALRALDIIAPAKQLSQIRAA